MQTRRKPYVCRYRNAGTLYSARIAAGSVAEAAAIMSRLPWGPDCGPVGLPRRYHPHLEGVLDCAAEALRWTRSLMAHEAGPGGTLAGDKGG